MLPGHYSCLDIHRWRESTLTYWWGMQRNLSASLVLKTFRCGRVMNIESSFPFRVVSGFRPLRGLHVGHYAAVLSDLIRDQYVQSQSTYVFVADHHARSKWIEATDFINIGRNTLKTARELLALGLDPDYSVIYRQSDVPEIFELMWFFAGLASHVRLRENHSFNADNSPTAGTYLYPLLMVGDILSLKASHVAIGRDQKQHLELARDVAGKLIRQFGPRLVPVPEYLNPEPLLIPGIDSRETELRKMASENHNEIAIFDDEQTVKDRINRIATLPLPWGAVLPPDGCNIVTYARCIGGPAIEAQFRQKYATSGYGFKEAKKDLTELFFDTFSAARQRFHKLD